MWRRLHFLSLLLPLREHNMARVSIKVLVWGNSQHHRTELEGQLAPRESNPMWKNNVRMSKASIPQRRVQLSVRPVICKLCFLWPATQRVFLLVHYPSKCQCSPNRSAKFKQRKSYLFLWNSVVCLQTWFHANRLDQTWGGHMGCAHPHYAFFVTPWDKTEAW